MDETGEAGTRLAELRVSARGWHGAQLAALGFIGLCGVLQRSGSEGLPRFLQITAGLLVLLALVLSCVATTLVATVAWPLGPGRRRDPGQDGEDDVLERGGQRLRAGVATTFVAVAVVALAATSSWWPRPSAPATLVEVTTGSSVLCGSLDEGASGTVGLTISGRRVDVALSDVVRLRAVGTCG